MQLFNQVLVFSPTVGGLAFAIGYSYLSLWAPRIRDCIFVLCARLALRLHIRIHVCISILDVLCRAPLL